VTPDLSLAFQIAGLVFLAGVFYAGVTRLRHDLNGIGRKLRETDARRQKEFLLTVALLIETSPPDHTKAIAQWLREIAK
jgi:hypothetical protein